jgi:hypothetical protein
VLPAEPCGEGLMAVPGETSCREVAPCGEGRWGAIAVDASTQFVDGSYPGVDSDGTAERPWTTVQAGVDAAEAGAIVAVASGSYFEDLVIRGAPVRVWGRCPAMVEIRGSATALAAVLVREDAAGSEMRDLAIRGGAFGVVVTGSEGIALDRVWIHDTADRGLVVQDDLGPTQVMLTRSLIEAAGDTGAFIGAAATTIEATVVRGTRAKPSAPGSGRGIVAGDRPETAQRATVTVRSSLVENNTDLGVFVWGSDATIEATVVRDTQPSSEGKSGWGMAIQDHAESGQRSIGRIDGSVIERNHDLGILVSGSDVTMQTSVVRDTLPRPADGKFGRGLTIKQNPESGQRANATVATSVIDRNHDVGLFVWGADATLESVLVRGTLGLADPDWLGSAIQVQLFVETGARSFATIRASTVDDNAGLGIAIAGSDANVAETLVRNTHARADGAFGDGLVVVAAYGPASAGIAASRVEGSARAGIVSFGAQVPLASTALECNAIHLDVETSEGLLGSIEDGGDNACGCGGEMVTCKAVSSNLAPPAPLEE